MFSLFPFVRSSRVCSASCVFVRACSCYYVFVCVSSRSFVFSSLAFVRVRIGSCPHSSVFALVRVSESRAIVRVCFAYSLYSFV